MAFLTRRFVVDWAKRASTPPILDDSDDLTILKKEWVGEVGVGWRGRSWVGAKQALEVVLIWRLVRGWWIFVDVFYYIELIMGRLRWVGVGWRCEVEGAYTLYV